MKRLLFLIFIFQFFSGQQAKAGGFSAWTEKTPYGAEMYHDGTSDGIIVLSLDSQSVAFKHFYFYKGHVVARSDSYFFIINEKTQDVQIYRSEAIWKTKIDEQNLVPFLKREYNSDYSSAFGSGVFFLLLLFPIPFIIPLLWLICLISLFFPSRRFYTFRKYVAWIYPTLVLIILFFDSYTQSF